MAVAKAFCPLILEVLKRLIGINRLRHYVELIALEPSGPKYLRVYADLRNIIFPLPIYTPGGGGGEERQAKNTTQ